MDRISALMDGELDGRHAEQEYLRLRQNTELRRAWNTFHLIGDALRGERLLVTDIASPLSKRLAEEPTVLAPQRSTRQVVTYALSAAASVSAIGLVAWAALAPHSSPAPRQDLARLPAPVTLPAPVPAPIAVTPVVSVPDEGRRNEYLLAHQGFSPSTAIQGVVPYIRSVSARPAYKDR